MPLVKARAQRIDEAVETLDRYILDPFWSDFLTAQKPRIPGAPREILKALVASVLHGTYTGERPYRIELTELERYLERLQLHGRQHVFLFTLKERQLVPLRDPKRLEELLGDHAGLYNAHQDVFPDNDEPELAAVTHDPERHLLRLQWIERRTWMEVEGTKVDETGKEIIIRNPRSERTANFFQVNLATGAADLRLQKLHGNAKQARLDLRLKYSRLVNETLHLTLPDPIVLAPAIRFALIDQQVDPDSWGTVLPDGGQWYASRGDRCPVELKELRAVIELKFTKRPQVGGTVHVLLDGQIDEIQIKNPCVPEVHAEILNEVRAWHDRAVAPLTREAPDPAQDTKPDPRFEPGPIVPNEGIIDRLKRLHQQAAAARLRREQPPEPARLDTAVVEYLASHRARKRSKKGGPASHYSIEQFVAYIDEVLEGDKRQHNARAAQLEKDERWLFRFSYLSTALALILIVVGAYLIFFTHSNLNVGVLGNIIGLLSGGATAMLRLNGKSLREMRSELERRWSERRRLQDHVHFVVTLDDDERRARELEEVAKELRLRVQPILEQKRRAA